MYVRRGSSAQNPRTLVQFEMKAEHWSAAVLLWYGGAKRGGFRPKCAGVRGFCQGTIMIPPNKGLAGKVSVLLPTVTTSWVLPAVALARLTVQLSDCALLVLAPVQDAV